MRMMRRLRYEDDEDATLRYKDDDKDYDLRMMKRLRYNDDDKH